MTGDRPTAVVRGTITGLDDRGDIIFVYLVPEGKRHAEHYELHLADDSEVVERVYSHELPCLATISYAKSQEGAPRVAGVSVRQPND